VKQPISEYRRRTDLADRTDGNVESHPVLETRASARRHHVVDGHCVVGGIRRQLKDEGAGTGLRQQQTVVDLALRLTPELSLENSHVR